MTAPLALQILARAIDPQAWAVGDRKWSYYRRRRATSLATAARVADLAKATAGEARA